MNSTVEFCKFELVQVSNFRLRYYATFKVRKCESLLCKINTCFRKNYQLHWIAGRVNILSKGIIYIIFQFWRWLLWLFFWYLQKLQILAVKKLWTDFCCIVLLFLRAQKERLRFLKCYFKLKILIFLSFMMFFLLVMFHWKAPFPTKKHQQWNLRSYQKLRWQRETRSVAKVGALQRFL